MRIGALLKDIVSWRRAPQNAFFIGGATMMDRAPRFDPGKRQALRKMLRLGTGLAAADLLIPRISSALGLHIAAGVGQHVPAACAALEPPEQENGYPEPTRFGAMPAYGFYIRHAERIEMSNFE